MDKRKAFKIGMLLALLFITALGLSLRGATTWTVCSSGCDFSSIQKAIDATSGGDTITVFGGPYEENPVIGKAIILLRLGPVEVEIKAKDTTEPTILIRAEGGAINGFKITQGKIGIQVENSERVTLTQNTLTGNGNGAVVLSSTDVTIVQNNIQENRGIGVAIRQNSKATATGNRLADNGSHGVEVLSSWVTLRNNVIQNNEGCGLNVDETASVQQEGNTVNDNTLGPFCMRGRDAMPPPAPRNLRVSPSGWTTESRFTVDWDNPEDPSGIRAYWYKLGAAPSSPTDGTHTMSKPITVTADWGEGERPIYIWLEDGAGNRNYRNHSSGTLRYDALPPTGFITINEGTEETWRTTVTLTVRAQDSGSSVDQMRFSNDGTSWSEWELYRPSKAWDLTAYGGNPNLGEKVVYVQFKDKAGNISDPTRAAIRLVQLSEMQILRVPEDFATIGEALQQIAPGRTILVAPGIYREAVVIQKSVTLRGEPSAEDFETGNLSKLPWQTGGDAHWYVAQTDRGFSAKAGEIYHSEQSFLEVQLIVPPEARVSFYFKVSSEPDADFLIFSIDGEEQGRWSGEIGWQKVSYQVSAGEHVFRWTYIKDISGDSGRDTAWVDDIQLLPGPTIVQPLYADYNEAIMQIKQAKDVKVEGFTIQGGSGVIITSSSNVFLANNTIERSSGTGVSLLDVIQTTLEQNTVQNNQNTGVKVISETVFSQVALRGNMIQNNGSAGLEVVASQVELIENTFTNNSDCGVLADEHSRVRGQENVAQDNGGRACLEEADLTIQLSQVPEEILAIDTIIMKAEVKNIASAAEIFNLAPFRIGFYLSPDETITREDLLLGFQEVHLQGLSTTVELRATALEDLFIRGEVAPGLLFLGAWVDDTKLVREVNEFNNLAVQSLQVKAPLTVCPLTYEYLDCDFIEIQAAIDIAERGEVILVLTGTYRNSLKITKPLTLKGAGPDRPIIEGLGDSVVSIESYEEIEVKLRGLVVRSHYSERGIGIKGRAHVTLQDVVSSSHNYGLLATDSARVDIFDSTFSGNHRGLAAKSSARVTIRGSTISENGDEGLLIGGSAQMKVRSSIISRNGIRCDGYFPCNGILVSHKSYLEVYDSTIRNNHDWGVAAELKKCGYSTDLFIGDVILENNRIYSNGRGDVCLPDLCIPEGACG